MFALTAPRDRLTHKPIHSGSVLCLHLQEAPTESEALARSDHTTTIYLKKHIRCDDDRRLNDDYKRNTEHEFYVLGFVSY